jgi:diguanylate cyclase (GGDEF)-like protein
VLLEHSRAVLGFDRAVVIGARGGDVEVLAADERPGSESEDPLQIGPDSVVTKSWSRHGPVLVRRLDGEDDPWLSEVLGTTERVTVLPMFADGMPAGAVVGTVAGLSQDRIERRIVDTGEQLSAHAALALRNAWLLEDVEELAVTDSLTHLANRRHLEHALSTLLADAGRDGSELAFLLVDLDRFKALNDTHGHLVGDDVLRIVGSALRDAVRDVDVVGRWGGEEFAVVLPGCGTETATAAAERIRIAIGTMPGPVPVSASVGVSVYPADGTERGALLRAADQALYESKRRGRDRVTVANAQSAGWLDLPWSSVAMPDLPDQPDQPVEADQADTDPFDPRADEQERKTVA